MDLALKTQPKIIYWIFTLKECENLRFRSCANTLLCFYIGRYSLPVVYFVNEKLRCIIFFF